MWKDFFYYSKSERRVILLLMFIALLLLGVWVGLHWLYPSSAPVGLSDSNEIDSFLVSLREKEKKSYSQPSFAKKKSIILQSKRNMHFPRGLAYPSKGPAKSKDSKKFRNPSFVSPINNLCL